MDDTVFIKNTLKKKKYQSKLSCIFCYLLENKIILYRNGPTL